MGRFYIGSAVCFSKRKSLHIFNLKRGTHHSKHLQSAWNKYGEHNFIFEIIEHIIDKNTLIEREQIFLDKLSPEYNNSKTAGSLLGHKLTPEQRKWRSENLRGNKAAMYGKKHSPETKIKIGNANRGRKLKKTIWNKGFCGKLSHSSKQINQLTLEGALIKIWDSISDVQKTLGFSKGNISQCCKHKRVQANGFKWQYAA